MFRSQAAPTRKLDRAAEMRREPTDGERLLWEALRTRRSPTRRALRVNRQQVLLGYIADFYLPRWRAIVEVDGGIHGSDQQADWDDRRDRAFQRAAYSVFRVADELVRADPDMVAELVEWYAESIDLLRGDGGPYGRSSDASVTWSFRGDAILRRGGELGTEREALHVFRVRDDLPDDYPITFGSDPGEVEYHDRVLCRAAGCSNPRTAR